MQRYRINYHLLVGLVIGSVVLSITAHFIWKWRVNSKATWYRERSARALEEGDKIEAFDYLGKFAKLRRDDEQVRVELASLASDIVVLESATREERGTAFAILEETVRQTGDADLRRKLADFHFAIGRSEAIVHYEELLAKTPDDPELNALYVRALFRSKDYRRATELALNLIGYDKNTKSFDPQKSKASDQPVLFATLASALVSRSKEPELAREVIELMIANNPESAVAHLQRSIFLSRVQEIDEAAAALERAYELDPLDADILNQKGWAALEDKDYEKAAQFFAKGLEEYPEVVLFYNQLARAELGRGQTDEALEVMDRCIKKFGKQRTVEQLLFKADVLLSKGDTEGVKKIALELEDLENPAFQPAIDFQYARITWHEKNWAQAAKQLKRVRPQLVAFGRTQALAGTMLGECYRNLGKLDLAREVFQLVLDDETVAANDPIKQLSRANIIQIENQLGISSGYQGTTLISLVEGILDLPEEQRDWSKTDEFIDAMAEQRDFSEVQKKLLHAQVFALRKMLPEAKQMVRDAAKLEPDNLNVRIAATKLLLMEPESGPAKALKLLGEIEKKHGVSLESRALKADVLMAIGDDKLLEQLRSLVEGTEDFSDAERLKLTSTLGVKFLQLQADDDAKHFLGQAAEMSPDNLPLRVQLFDIALRQGDDAAMREAQQKILDLVKSKEDGNYILTEVKRLIVGSRQGKSSPEVLAEARKLLDKALRERPRWHELHVLYGQLLLMQGGETDLALEHFNDALKYGPPNAGAVVIHVRQLESRGDYKQALEKMDVLPAGARTRLLGQTEANILLKMGDLDAAFESAQKLAKALPENVAIQLWFAQLAQQADHFDPAEEAFEKACELQPLAPENWMKLVALYAQKKESDKIEDTIRRAQLAVEAEFTPLVQAKYFEIRGRWRAAEKIYSASYGATLEDPMNARRMAEFYLFWSKSDAENLSRAAPYLNSILRSANEGTLASDDPNVVWAREKAARLLAASRDYRKSVQAEKLLMQASVDGQLPKEYQTLYSEILFSRADPISLLAGIDILTELNERGKLDKKQTLLLANLLARANNWKLGKELMLDALGQFGSDSDVWAAYIDLLIRQGEYSVAAQRLNRYKDIAESSLSVIQLRVQLASARGDQVEVERLLRSMLPPQLDGALDDNQLRIVRAVAGIAAKYKDYELAEKLFQLYVRRSPESGFDLANFLALHGDPDTAVSIMKRLLKQQPEQVIQLAVQMLRERRTVIGDKYDADVQQMVAEALRDDPESSSRIAIHAEMLEVLEKYDQSIAAYEDLLKRDDVQLMARAAAMNNVAFLLALRNERLEDAQQYIDGAIELLGPVADALDTRAVIRIARKEYDLAIEDMSLALSIDPNAVKYYHLARAHLLGGNNDLALKAWQDGEKLGLEKESLTIIEQKGFEEVQQQIEGLRSQNAKL